MILLLPLALATLCGPVPPAPPQTDVWAVQVTETLWRSEVPGWVVAPYPVCWVMGRVDLAYDDSADTPLVEEPTPWAAGMDYPAGDACPVEAVAGCYTPVMPVPVVVEP